MAIRLSNKALAAEYIAYMMLGYSGHSPWTEDFHSCFEDYLEHNFDGEKITESRMDKIRQEVFDYKDTVIDLIAGYKSSDALLKKAFKSQGH